MKDDARIESYIKGQEERKAQRRKVMSEAFQKLLCACGHYPKQNCLTKCKEEKK